MFEVTLTIYSTLFYFDLIQTWSKVLHVGLCNKGQGLIRKDDVCTENSLKEGLSPQKRILL